MSIRSAASQQGKQQRVKPDCGFTLVELVTVVVILGTIALIALFAYRRYLYKAEVISSVSDLGMIEKSIYGYTIDHQGNLPADLGAVEYGGLRDPWGRLYVFQPDLTVSPRTRAGANINQSYDLYSVGKDGFTAQDIGAPESLDDVILADDGRYKGLAERF